MEPDDYRKRILDELWKVRIFDVHSHYCSPGDPVEGLDEYICGWSQPETSPVGLSERELDRWRRSRFEAKRSLWFCRSFRVAMQDLYGTRDDGEIVERMNEVRGMGLPSSMEWMRERSNVGYLVVDTNIDLAAEIGWVLSTFRLDSGVLSPYSGTLEEKMEGLEADIEDLAERWAIACFKIPIAYSRSLYMEEVSPEEAGRIESEDAGSRSAVEQRRLEDYVYRRIIRKAGELNLPVEIHTGFGWAIGQRPLRLSEADPENLLPVLEDPECRKTRFILFHGGYPFMSKAGYLAGTFSNVYLDFTCLSAQSSAVLKRGLDEWIDIVPMDRIVCGSDGSYEWLYFASRYNRECLAAVLAGKCAEGQMDLDLALEMGGRILRGNALSVFEMK